MSLKCEMPQTCVCLSSVADKSPAPQGGGGGSCSGQSSIPFKTLSRSSSSINTFRDAELLKNMDEETDTRLLYTRDAYSLSFPSTIPYGTP